MSNVAIMFLFIGLRWLWSGGIQVLAASRVAPFRAEFIAGRVYRDNFYSGASDVAWSIGLILAALFGNLALDLHPVIIAIFLVLLELKLRAVDRLALTTAGFFKPPDAPAVDGQEIG